MTITEVKQQLSLFKDPKTIEFWIEEHEQSLSQVCVAYAKYRVHLLSPKQRVQKKVEKKESEFVQIFDGQLFP